MAPVHECQADLTRRRFRQLFCQDLSAAGLDHHPIARTNRRAQRDHNDVALTIDRQHTVSANRQRVGIGVTKIGKIECLLAGCAGITGVIEKPGAPRLRKTDHRNLERNRLPIARFEQSSELGHVRIRRIQNTRQAFRRWPTRTPILPAFAFRKGRSIQSGHARQLRYAQSIVLREQIDCPSDVTMCHHHFSPSPWQPPNDAVVRFNYDVLILFFILSYSLSGLQITNFLAVF